MAQPPLPHPCHMEADQKFVNPLIVHWPPPPEIQKLQQLRLYLVQISCPLQTNQILHDGSALCMISVAVRHLGLSIFLKPKLTNALLIHDGSITS
jgi:hypothetical protein